MRNISLHIFFLTLVLMVFPIQHIFGQNNDRSASGSFYSSIGFGIPVDHASPYSMGMGLTGVSNFSGFTISASNPAHWGLISFSQGNLSIGLNQYDAADFSRTAKSAYFGIEHFQMAFPLLRNKLGFSISFAPSVRADFRRRELGTFTPIEGIVSGNIDYLLDTVGSGGINRFETGIGYRLTDFISVGYAFSANLLSLNTEVQPVFSDSQFRTAPYNSTTAGNSFSHRFGLHAFTSGLFSSNDQLTFGATLSLPYSIDAEQNISSFRLVNNQRVRVELNENSPNRNGTVKLPLEFNSGLTYNLNRVSNVVAELMLQKWDDAEYSFDVSQQNYYKDRIRAGIGLQYHPYRAEQTGGFFSNFKYSIGTTYDTGHLSINGQDIETVFLNAGIGLMSNRSPSSIDLSFHYGFRGTESSNLVKENIWGFKLSLNMAEFMFLRQRFQ